MRGTKRLQDDAATLADSEVSADAGVMAVISKRLVKRRRKDDDAPEDETHYDLNDPDRPVILEIPDGTTEISADAFAKCGSVVSVTVPDSVTKIGDGAFYGCKALEKVIIPESVTRIGDRAFMNCKSLTSLTIPKSVVEIGTRSLTAARY